MVLLSLGNPSLLKLKTGKTTGGISIIEEKIDAIACDKGTLATIEAFIESSMNASNDCRNQIISALDKLDGQLRHYWKAIQEARDRVKEES